MKFLRYEETGVHYYGILKEDGQVYRLGAAPFKKVVIKELAGHISKLHLLAPVMPGKIIGAARNTHSQANQRGWDPPTEPEFFLKPPSSIIGPGDIIYCPPQAQQVVHESELAIVIRKQAAHVSIEEVRHVILGFTCANDITARDLMLKDRLVARSKGFDTFCPLGPVIVDNILSPETRILCRVNGEIRQDATLSDYVYSPEKLVSLISEIMTLFPGDVLLCGSPAGVGPIMPGDVVEVEIEGIGVLANPVKKFCEIKMEI